VDFDQSVRNPFAAQNEVREALAPISSKTYPPAGILNAIIEAEAAVVRMVYERYTVRGLSMLN
jgi:hypothetical protein